MIFIILQLITRSWTTKIATAQEKEQNELLHAMVCPLGLGLWILEILLKSKNIHYACGETIFLLFVTLYFLGKFQNVVVRTVDLVAV